MIEKLHFEGIEDPLAEVKTELLRLEQVAVDSLELIKEPVSDHLVEFIPTSVSSSSSRERLCKYGRSDPDLLLQGLPQFVIIESKLTEFMLHLHQLGLIF